MAHNCSLIAELVTIRPRRYMCCNTKSDFIYQEEGNIVCSASE